MQGQVKTKRRGKSVMRTERNQQAHVQTHEKKCVKKLKNMAACILAAALTAGLICGCQKETGQSVGTSSMAGEQAGENGSSKENPSKEKNAANPDGSGEGENPTEAMGRYREIEMELPEEVEEQSLIGFFRGEEDVLELYTVERDASGYVADAFRYLYRDSKWEKDEAWAGKDLLKEHGLDMELVAYGADGRYYLGGTDADYRFHLLKVQADNQGNNGAEEILSELFLPEEGRDYGLIPPKIEVLENGNLLVYDYYEVYLCTPLGERLLTMSKDFSGTTSDARGFGDKDSFTTVQGERLVRYDLSSGQMTDIAGLEEVESSKEGLKLFGDGNGGVYAAGETGLAHLHKGGTLWEILIDGSLNHMGMRSLNLSGFFAGNDPNYENVQDYYGVFTSTGGKGISVFHYVYDPDMLAVPPSVLTVYSLNDISTVRQAASQFQSEHPEVKVELRTAVEDGEAAGEEVIQSLNTELLSKKGADVLILDGLPAESYVEKGILMDISDLVGEMKEEGIISGNFTDGFTMEDGAVYQIPSRVYVPLLLGEEEAVDAYDGLQAMADYAGEKPLLAAENYENLLREIACVQYPELFLEGKIRTPEGLHAYLETVKSLGEANGSKTIFTSESEMEEKWVSNNVAANGLTGSAVNFDAGQCASGLECLDGLGDLCIPAQVKKQRPGIEMKPVKNLYLPSGMAGINRSTQNAELAREFIRCLLSYEVQKEELYDGFPVNKKALEALTEKETNGYVISVGYRGWEGSDGKDYELHAEWPPKAVRKELVEQMQKLTVPVLVDENVMKMIVEGSKDYLEDKESAGQAAEKIFRKLSVYLAE